MNYIITIGMKTFIIKFSFSYTQITNSTKHADGMKYSLIRSFLLFVTISVHLIFWLNFLVCYLRIGIVYLLNVTGRGITLH